MKNVKKECSQSPTLFIFHKFKMMKKLMKPLFFDHQHGHHHHHENHKQKMMNCVRGKLGEKKPKKF